MKRILTFCSLFFLTTLAFADTCPQPREGYVFRVAAWGNHYDSTSQIRCHYYLKNDLSRYYEVHTNEYYHEKDMARLTRWSASNHYYLCTSFNTDVNECAFSRR